jgi:hypothetical protein
MRREITKRNSPEDLLQVAGAIGEQTDLALYHAEMQAYAQTELINIQVNMVNDVIGHAAEGEMATLDQLREKAGDSAAKQHLAASWATLGHSLNMRTVQRGLT